jgi:Trypsin-like peptidase domain/Protein of unknown function (DUF5663)
VSETVLELLRQATVQLIDNEGEHRGSGFFIAPGLVMTAAHVVERFGSQSLWVRWGNRQPVIAMTEWILPPHGTPGIDVYPLPDLAVLKVPAALDLDHPCVMLSEKITGREFAAQGFTRGVTIDGVSPDPVVVTFEGIKPEPGGDLIKCKGAILEEGMSGGPLLDLESGLVIGVVKAQRARDLPAGLYASHANGLLSNRADLWALCQLVHQTDKRWVQAIRPGAVVRDPRQAAISVLEKTLQGVQERIWNLPTHVNRAALHQTIWVQRVASSDVRTSAGGVPVSVGERFRWRPLRENGKTIIVRGLPGHGKSWLLAYHAETIATNSLAALESSVDPTRLRLPVLIDATNLGAVLPPNPDRNDVVQAVLSTAGLGGVTGGEIMIAAREAFESGRLVVCTDGLDEVPVRFRPRLQKALAIIAASLSSLVVATRYNTLNLLDRMPTEGRVDVETLGFTPREAARFATVWLSRDPDRRAALMRAIETNSPLRDLASVPLLLSFLCRLAGDQYRAGALPTSRTLLYQEVLDSLLSGKWSGAGNQIDPEWSSEPNKRLRALADSLGALLDSWRSSGDSISRAELSAQLARHPDYERLRLLSVARWNAWQREREAEPTEPPPDPVLWEFAFDGLLVYGDSDSVRILHPSLRDFLLASYLANLDTGALQAALERHRWFDADWQDIFAAAMPLIADPNPLIRSIIAVPGDPWLSQALFAAKCVAEGGTKVTDETSRQVIHALLDRTKLARLADVRRSAEGLAALVRAGIEPAVSRALSICAAAEDTRRELYLAVVSMLADTGHPEGVSRAVDLLKSGGIPRRHRETLISALSATEDEDVLALLFDRLTTTGMPGDLEAFLAAVKPQSDRLIATAVRLLRARRLAYTARTTIAAALIECGDPGIEAVRQAANDETMEWAFRCRTGALLINADVPGAAEQANGVLRNPSVRALDKSYLIEAMLRSSELTALPMAASLMLDHYLDWSRRAALASAICALGTEGITLLRQQLTAGLPLELTVRHLVALVEVRDPIGVPLAIRIAQQEGMPSSIRATVLLALWQWEPDAAAIAAAVQLVGDAGLEHFDRIRLTAALIRADAPGGMDALRATLEGDDGNSRWPETSRMIAAAGRSGRRALAALVADPSLSWGIRSEAILALASTATKEEEVTAVVTEATANEIPSAWHDRLIFSLTAAGYSQFADAVISYLPTREGAYNVIYEYLRRPNASLDWYFNNLSALTAAMSVLPESSRTSINAELMRECNLTWVSDTELKILGQWFYKLMEVRVGRSLFNLMTNNQFKEFQDLVDSSENGASNDDGLDWLNTNFPEYGSFVRQEYGILKEEIKTGKIKPPQTGHESSTEDETLTSMQFVLAKLDQFASLVRRRDIDDSLAFLDRNRNVLLSRNSELLLEAAIRLNASWPFHQTLLFAVRYTRSTSIQDLSQLSVDSNLTWERLVEFLDNGDHEMLYLCGSFAAFHFPRSASCIFYAAIGFELLGRHEAAVVQMRRSGSLADEEQLAQGRDTVMNKLNVRFKWADDHVTDLINALSQGYEQAHPDSGTGVVPDSPPQ